MAKLRKMLGDVDSPECIAMMRLIETQSETTLARWALGYVESRILSIYKKKAGGDRRLDVLVQACQQVVQMNQPEKQGNPGLRKPVKSPGKPQIRLPKRCPCDCRGLRHADNADLGAGISVLCHRRSGL